MAGCVIKPGNHIVKCLRYAGILQSAVNIMGLVCGISLLASIKLPIVMCEWDIILGIAAYGATNASTQVIDHSNVASMDWDLPTWHG
jgi:hypothetical protein